MRNARLFCLPSWYEALGCVYLEAMASGIPTIGCYGNGIDEIIIDGSNGYLVHEKSYQEIYDKIVLLRQQNEDFSISKNARETVQSKYTWLDSAKALNNIYIDVR